MKRNFTILLAVFFCATLAIAGDFSVRRSTPRANKGTAYTVYCYTAPLAKITTTKKDTIIFASGSTFGDIAGDDFTVYLKNTAYTGTDSGFVKLSLEVGGDSSGYFMPDSTGSAKVIKAKWAPGTSLTINIADYLRAGTIIKRWRIIAEKGTNFQATDSVAISREVTRKNYFQ